MTVDDLLGRRRRHPLLRLATFTLLTCGIAGLAFLGVRGWNGKTETIGLPPAVSVDPIQTGAIPGGQAPSIDPIQTGSMPAGDAIGDMIEKLGGKAAPHHR